MILIIIEYVILQSILIWWFVHTVKKYPKKNNAYSYKILVGNIGIIVVLSVILIIDLVNDRSFLKQLVESIFN